MERDAIDNGISFAVEGTTSRRTPRTTMEGQRPRRDS